jgi:hypothetical protein
MKTPNSRRAIAIGAVAVGALGGAGVMALVSGANPVVRFTPTAALGQTDDSTTTTVAPQNNDTPTTTAPSTDADNGNGNAAPADPKHCDRTPLDAATEAKVKDAALAAVPGATFVHAHQDRDGGYEALLTKADGTKVLVHEDAAFKVTSVEDPAPARGPRGGHGDRTPLDADTAAKVEAAAKAAVPNATVDHTGKDRDGSGYVAMMEKADGTHVLVHEDANFKGTSVEDPAPMRGPGPGGHHRGPDGDGAGAPAPAA